MDLEAVFGKRKYIDPKTMEALSKDIRCFSMLLQIDFNTHLPWLDGWLPSHLCRTETRNWSRGRKRFEISYMVTEARMSKIRHGISWLPIRYKDHQMSFDIFAPMI